MGRRESTMPTSVFLGEFEQLVLLTILNLDNAAYAIDLRQEISRMAGRSTSRGALYRTLERLETKGYASWRLEKGDASRSGHPKRLFSVTEAGMAVLRRSRDAWADLWAGAEEALG